MLIRKLFNKKVRGEELNNLILSLGKSKDFVQSLYTTKEGYHHSAYGKLNMHKIGHGFSFGLDIIETYSDAGKNYNPSKNFKEKTYSIKKIVPIEKINSFPILRKYISNDISFKDSIIFDRFSLEKSLVVFSVASILASTFFISNNITGNAILTATPNSSGIIGAGLFVLGVVSWIFARNI